MTQTPELRSSIESRAELVLPESTREQVRSTVRALWALMRLLKDVGHERELWTLFHEYASGKTLIFTPHLPEQGDPSIFVKLGDDGVTVCIKKLHFEKLPPDGQSATDRRLMVASTCLSIADGRPFPALNGLSIEVHGDAKLWGRLAKAIGKSTLVTA
ncbi:MAG: hypothetical protein H6619_04265 [Deltaproteobacteria bacterium]|nr:hypothetical protein [Deltaproteobacteria bacterium]